MHPIVAQMQPSSEQEPAITARGRDVVITAGAGAGKTLTLVARYLALLAEGLPLRAIIAITFTEKAAREMRNRVRDEVRRYLETPGLDAGEHEHGTPCTQGLDAARISTIHGLCAEILRSHPAEARVDPRFDVLDEGQGNLLRRQAVDETLAWAAEAPELAPLFGLLGERGFRFTLDTLLRGRLEAAEAFSKMPDDVLAHWQAALTAQQTKALAELLASPDWRDAAATVRNEAATQTDDLLEVQRRSVAAALAEAAADAPVSDRLTALRPLDAIKLNVGKIKAWPGRHGPDQGGLAGVARILEERNDFAVGAHAAGRSAGCGPARAARLLPVRPQSLHDSEARAGGAGFRRPGGRRAGTVGAESCGADTLAG